MRAPIVRGILAYRSFRAVERAAAFGLDLGLVMDPPRYAAPSPHHLSPARVNNPAGQDPEARLSRSKPPQERSDHARKPSATAVCNPTGKLTIADRRDEPTRKARSRVYSITSPALASQCRRHGVVMLQPSESKRNSASSPLIWAVSRVVSKP